MKTILSRTLSLIFFAIALLHFYWAVGGEAGLASALPSNTQGDILLNPGWIDATIIGLGLTVMGFVYLSPINTIQNNFLRKAKSIGLWIIPFIFLLRAIGDFTYVGLFKSVKSTTFGQMDTLYYTPLCMAIAIAGFSIVYLNRSN